MASKISEITKYINKNSKNQKDWPKERIHGWHDGNVDAYRLIALLNSDIGEAIQAERYNEGKDAVLDELASCFVRLLDLVNCYGIYIDRLRTKEKMKKSEKVNNFAESISYVIASLSTVISSIQRTGEPSAYSISVFSYHLVNCANLFCETDKFLSIVDSVRRRIKKQIHKDKAA